METALVSRLCDQSSRVHGHLGWIRSKGVGWQEFLCHQRITHLPISQDWESTAHTPRSTCQEMPHCRSQDHSSQWLQSPNINTSNTQPPHPTKYMLSSKEKQKKTRWWWWWCNQRCNQFGQELLIWHSDRVIRNYKTKQKTFINIIYRFCWNSSTNWQQQNSCDHHTRWDLQCVKSLRNKGKKSEKEEEEEESSPISTRMPSPCYAPLHICNPPEHPNPNLKPG